MVCGVVYADASDCQRGAAVDGYRYIGTAKDVLFAGAEGDLENDGAVECDIIFQAGTEGGGVAGASGVGSAARGHVAGCWMHGELGPLLGLDLHPALWEGIVAGNLVYVRDVDGLYKLYGHYSVF